MRHNISAAASKEAKLRVDSAAAMAAAAAAKEHRCLLALLFAAV